ncbi:unnamed protein product [Echinostoma caproni]|uniref:Uncharacterized protein n=1 Tax=Echinostoma caproni TaxID=27848 RepID=A0A3P8KDK5_9TREM|nr:unnamed protein product [Echinostoma caproni]
MHMASRVGSADIARMLIDFGMCTDTEDLALQTAMHKAAERNNLDVMKLLIKKGSNMENEDSNACTPLLLAVSKGHVEIVQLLIEHGANLFAQDKNAKSVIYLSAECNSLDVLRMILLNDKAKKLINVPNIYGNTALHVAAKLGHLEVVKTLLDNGANLLAKNERERLAFHYAAKKGRLQQTLVNHVVELADELLFGGLVKPCDLRETAKPDPTRETQMVTHCFVRATARVQLVLDLDDSSVIKGNYDQRRVQCLDCTPSDAFFTMGIMGHTHFFSFACHALTPRGCDSIARLLLRKAPSVVSELDEDGNSAIHLAAAKGHQKVIDLLLKCGAAVDSRNSMRWAPLDCAAANGHRACAQFLLENDSPTTPLHLACKHGHTCLVELLLDWGADPGVRLVLNENTPGCGPNALDSAIDHGQKYVMHVCSLYMYLAEYVLDRCLTQSSSREDDYGSGIVHYNFEFVEDTYAYWSGPAIQRAEETKQFKNGTGMFAGSSQQVQLKNAQFSQFEKCGENGEFELVSSSGK